jgi:hypothetical protein
MHDLVAHCWVLVGLIIRPGSGQCKCAYRNVRNPFDTTIQSRSRGIDREALDALQVLVEGGGNDDFPNRHTNSVPKNSQDR